MQRSTYLVSTLIFFVILNFTACGGNYSDAKKAIKKQGNIFEDYIESMEKAENADDLVDAINTFSEEMTDMLPELKKIAAKYPELNEQKEPPAELKEEYEKIEAFSEKISVIMMKNFKYLADPKVQKAIQEQGKIMTEDFNQD